MFTHDMIAFAFRLINLAIVFGFAWYLFKRYALAMIKDKIAKRQQELAALEQETRALAHKQQILEQEIADDHELSHVLRQKLERWNDVFTKRVSAREQEKEARKISLQKKIARVQDYVQESYMHDMVPQAVERARTLLVQEFEHKDRSERFMQDLINYMHQSSSKKDIS